MATSLSASAGEEDDGRRDTDQLACPDEGVNDLLLKAEAGGRREGWGPAAESASRAAAQAFVLLSGPAGGMIPPS